jgi:hypothetical protein
VKLPNAEKACVDLVKLRDYVLNPLHDQGRHKSRVFASALGLTRADAAWLRAELLRAAKECDCTLGRQTPHGQRYVQTFVLRRGEMTCRIRSVWNVRPGENFPRLITCFVV